MDRHARSKMNTQIYEEACTWFVEARAGDLDDSGRRDLDRWLRKSPEHLSAYLEIAAIWNEGSKFDPSNKWVVDALIRDALEAGDDNIVSLPRAITGEMSPDLSRRTTSGTGPTDVRSTPHPTGRSGVHSSSKVSAAWFQQWRRLAIAASIAILAILGGTLTMVELSAPTYTTALGERRSIEFADGSTVELNSRSKIRVKYSKQERDVELIEGQALFHVAHDTSRPFIVAVGAARVRAVGTQFDVYKKSSATVVTVVEGRVAVYAATVPRPPPSPPSEEEPVAPGLTTETRSSFLLGAGEQLTVTSESAQKTASPNVSGATAWTRAEIVFDAATLSDVAEEFNRYNERQLIIEDPELLNFHISGTFSSVDPESLIRFLRQRPGVQVTETGGKIRVSGAFPSVGIQR
jgi:ferric-dicitrate binding protein FerR (iron transport regulator)